MAEPTTPTIHDPMVAVLHWPGEEARRLRLAELGVPRLLLVDEGGLPPTPVDDLEDWVRSPLSPADLVVRMDVLRRRAARRDAPTLDDDGLLHFRGEFVVIPETQVPVVRLLIERMGSLVRTADLVAAYEAGGGTGSRNVVSTMLFRLRARIAELGLGLQLIRQRGVVLDVLASGDGGVV